MAAKCSRCSLHVHVHDDRNSDDAWRNKFPDHLRTFSRVPVQIRVLEVTQTHIHIHTHSNSHSFPVTVVLDL